MRRSLSYADAVRMLSGGESSLGKVLDRLSPAGVLTMPGADVAELCREVVRLGEEVLTRLGERLQGLDRVTRTDRLRAAHAVIVVTAYFEMLEQVFAELPHPRVVQLAPGGELSWAKDGYADSKLPGLLDVLIGIDQDIPTAVQSFEVRLRNLEAFYRGLSGRVAVFLADSPAWEALDQAERDRFGSRLQEAVPGLAVSRYEELFRRLVAECPEFGIWVSMFDWQAPRAELRNGLAGLGQLLESITCGRLPDQRRAALARAYQVALAKPIAPSGEVPAELQIPALGQGYIDHRIRVAEVTASSDPGRDSWWNDVPVRDDACEFLAGFLTSPAAQESPLILLGQPGSGKSVVTRVLAARLPVADFLPVRVELRQVPAEADLQEQIEFAVRDATGERVPWPRLVESGDGALPVVMLDGFDELLQATGVAQTDFLLRVRSFQEREADQGRPLAIIVTSRTAVADRAHIPHGAIAVRLEPFDNEQVTAWLEVWGRSNTTPLAARGLRPLPAPVALHHQELAEQPLLLLMLALYDADANALQHQSADLSQTELYGRLLEEFARREIRKHSPKLAETDLERAAEAELLRLSVVAFAMFNRRSQWVTEADLDRDLSALLGEGRDLRRIEGLRAALTAAQLTVGRFFFVHESQATRDEERLQSFEFLHATFGEFLVARLIAQVLSSMLAREAAAASLPLSGVDDGLLHALLSFAALTSRGPIMAFLGDLLDRLAVQQREALTDLILQLHTRALYARKESAYSGYEPLALTAPERHAAWSANLVVIAVLTAGEVSGAELFPQEPDPTWAWRNQAMIWRSQLSPGEWQGLYEMLSLKREWDGQRREIRLRRDGATSSPPDTDIHWLFAIQHGHPSRSGLFVDPTTNARLMQRKINFACNLSEDIMNYDLMAVSAPFSAVANTYITLADGRPVSVTRTLTAALIALHGNGRTADPVYADLAHVTHELALATNQEGGFAPYLNLAVSVLISAVERGISPLASLEPLATVARNGNIGDSQLAELLTHVERLLSGPISQ
jgi:hypothetical protein